MNKCQNCGAEYEGNFCPNCGTPAANPTEAPVHSGLRPSAGSKGGASPFVKKVFALRPYFLPVLFALFSASLFLICLGDVSVSPVGGMGSIYDYLSEYGVIARGMGMGTAVDCCIALIVFGALGAALACCALLFRFYIPLRVRKIGERRVCFYLECGICALLFAEFILSCVLCGAAKNELFRPGAGSVCALVFSLLFGVCAVAVAFLPKLLKKAAPTAVAEYKAERARVCAEMERPKEPTGEKLQKPQKPKYRVVATPTDELLAQTMKYGKAKKLFVIFACIGVALFALLFLFATYMESNFNGGARG